MSGESLSGRGEPVALIPEVVSQHAEEAACLRSIRTSLLRAPRVRLWQLRHRCDDRLAAHLDGLSIAGDQGARLCEALLEESSVGTVFTVSVRAIENRQRERLDRLFALVQAVPDAGQGLLSAFGWVGRDQLQGVVANLLGAPEPFRRMTGIAACGMHRVDPSLLTARRIFDPTPVVRARALRTTGETGCAEAAPACGAALSDDDSECAFWAAWSSVLLGNRGAGLQLLTSTGLAAGPHQQRAFRLAAQAMSLGAAHEALRELAKDSTNVRWLILGSGIAGDPSYVPWLIGHMANEQTARLAAEAFSLITGEDLEQSKLERERPGDFVSGPTEDPDDPSVDMDADEGLPWPDVGKIDKWWSANGSRFQKGTRYFMGAPVTRELCTDVLKNGYQRQRILAAQYLCLLEPGTPLFNTSAPAWRQQKLLATM